MMREPPKFSPEVIERAVRMVFVAKDQWSALSGAEGVFCALQPGLVKLSEIERHCNGFCKFTPSALTPKT